MTDSPDILTIIEEALRDTYLDDLEGIKSWREYAEAVAEALGLEVSA